MPSKIRVFNSPLIVSFIQRSNDGIPTATLQLFAFRQDHIVLSVTLDNQNGPIVPLYLHDIGDHWVTGTTKLTH